MITVPVASRTTYWKSYGTACVPDLEALKQAIADAGRTLVHLITVDRWEDDWDYFRANIPLGELSEEDLSWVWQPGGRRYLVCGL